MTEIRALVLEAVDATEREAVGARRVL